MLKDKIKLATRCNSSKTHPYIYHNGEFFNKGIHAELAAIMSVKNKEKLKGATIYICRILKNGDFAIAKPCKMCLNLIKQYGIKKMIYTANVGIIEKNF